MSVVENIQNVRAKIAAAAEKSGRTAEDVLLLAVSKTKPVELIGEAVQAGCLSLGENKVQEIMEKYEPMMEYAPDEAKNPLGEVIDILGMGVGEIYH